MQTDINTSTSINCIYSLVCLGFIRRCSGFSLLFKLFSNLLRPSEHESLFSFYIIIMHRHTQHKLFPVSEVISASVISFNTSAHLWQRKWIELAIKVHYKRNHSAA